MPTPDTTSPSHFIRDIVAEDRRQNKNDGRVATIIVTFPYKGGAPVMHRA